MELGNLPAISKPVMFRDVTLPKLAVEGILPQVTPYELHHAGRFDDPTSGEVDQAAIFFAI